MPNDTAASDYGTVADGFGSEWPRCGPRCDIEIVRPGKVQCNMTDDACLDVPYLAAEVQRLRDELGVATTVRDAHLARAERAEGKPLAVWPVLCQDSEHDTVIAVIGATLEAAKKATEDYCGTPLVWEARNSIFDFQDYHVAKHPDDGSEFHVFEQEVGR